MPIKISISHECTTYLLTMTKYQTAEFFEYTISNVPEISYKNAKRGRPANGKASEKITIVEDRFRVDLTFKNEALEHTLFRCGYYPLITNKPQEELSIKDAMMAHKEQYKREQDLRSFIFKKLRSFIIQSVMIFNVRYTLSIFNEQRKSWRAYLSPRKK